MATYVRTQTIEHPIGADGALDLRVVDSDVRLRAVEGTDARLRITFEIRAASDADADRIFSEIQFVVRPEVGRLSVSQHEDSRGGFGAVMSRLFLGGGEGHLNASVEGELPPMTVLGMEGVSADMETTGFHGQQRYETVSGDLLISEAGGAITLNTVSGDTSLRADDPVELRVEAVSGDVRLLAPQLRGLRTTSVSGDVEIEAAFGPGEYRVQTVSGDLSVGLAGPATFEVRGMSTDIDSDIDHRLEGHADRRRLVIGSGGPTLIFSTMSGDLSVHRPRRMEASISAPASPPAAETSASSLEVLRALEAGEIDVDEAARRLGER